MALWVASVALGLLGACENASAPLPAGDDAAAPEATAPDSKRDLDEPSSECTPKVVADAIVPAPYRGLQNPLPPSATVLSAGKARFDGRCALCHGLAGRGDGREGPFDPPAADLTARLRRDDYLFWRISEGGNVDPFCTAMPAFGNLYSERARWELVAYLRELGGAGDASTADGGGD